MEQRSLTDYLIYALLSKIEKHAENWEFPFTETNEVLLFNRLREDVHKCFKIIQNASACVGLGIGGFLSFIGVAVFHIYPVIVLVWIVTGGFIGLLLTSGAYVLFKKRVTLPKDK